MFKTPLRQMLSYGFLVSMIVVLGGCATTPPQRVDDLCSIFAEKRHWHKAAKQAQRKWGSSIPTMMAVMHQESRFNAVARPKFRWFLFVPLGRKSSAFGYSQALETTWDGYKKSTKNWGADRDDFADSIDFVGWYLAQSYRRNGIPLNDTYKLYLTYHEGHGGYARGTYRSKTWLLNVANKVARQALMYEKQYTLCR